jgi:hypothetical protein
VVGEFLEKNVEIQDLSGNFLNFRRGAVFLNFRMPGDKLTNQR